MNNLNWWNPLDWGQMMITGASSKINEIFNGFMDSFLKTGENLLNNLDKFSFNACLIIGLVALVLSIFGYRKGKKIALISPAIYVILQIFLSVWFGV